jgi:phage replication O-like protein O
VVEWMANPQKENGFTPIANELIDYLCKMSFNGTQFRIIFVVFRYTYGFNRKEHELSETFIASALGTHKRQIQRELKSLLDMNVLEVIKPATFNSSRVVAFNKYYDRWLINQQVTKTTPGDKNVPHTGDVLDASRGGELVTQEIQIKDNIKDILHEEEKKPKKTVKEKAESTQVSDYFCKIHFDKYKIKYMFHGAKDGTALSKLMKVYDVEFMKAFIDWYFESNDEFINKSGREISKMPAQVAKYIQEKIKKPQQQSKYRDLSNYKPGE